MNFFFLRGDLNCHAWGYVGEVNTASKTISDFVVAFDFTIANACFRKKGAYYNAQELGGMLSLISF